MNNFDFLRDEPRFAAFAGVAISAERIILIDPDMCILNCRRAMEFAIKWIYSVETSLETPYQDNLHSLLNSEDFRDYVGNDLWRRLDYIRRKGNSVAHNNRRQGFDEAMLCLENLHIFMDFISCCYVRGYEQREFDRNAILNRRENAKKSRENAENAKSQLKEQEELIRQNQEEIERQKIDLKTLAEENADLKEKLSARSQVQRKRYKQHPLDISEFETRKLYIDAMLEDAGWVQGSDWIDEVEVDGVPSRSGNGRVDYVLYDYTQRPLAIIEAKKTCVGVEAGRYQAKEYADSIERKYGRRPVIFLTNGFETHIIDGQYPERKCSCIYSKRDLEKWFNLRSMRTSLRNVTVDKTIAGRYYQEAAIKAVCDAFDQKNRRKALLVMATGSGKTRTVIALCKILINAGWVKNILFLADRNSLVTQAKRNFVNMLQDLSCTNLVEEKNNYNARCVFSTYQTMIGCVDSASDKDGRIFTCGHFDLIICDEAHRSIYNKYKDIFTYFDAPLVGLTATPKDEVDKNTYDIFELANGVPTYGYDLAQAVEDEYLVDYMTIESKVKFLDEGIVYEELSDADKEEYEKTFVTESGDVPDKIESAALNSWLFNKDTIRKVLRVFMDNGIKIDYMYMAGKWHDIQKYVFDNKIVQPFKQVFRELYVKTEEEMNMEHSLRYAGNQIQPKKTLGCLKSRHWVADIEDGLQKVYYKENIVAQIYALADWFSPADIESPTLEWVVFSDRKTGKDMRIKDIPDIIFSEVMRDVDMAVSVAHAGGVDPETSHSTVEMRKAIAEFTMPLFKLTNVTFTKNHAVIEGKRANYTVHLGSGVVHQEAGPMINVLPVHSQRRGRIFLPFVDDDPKTSEVLTKILFFAEDNKIKDPYILEQIEA